MIICLLFAWQNYEFKMLNYSLCRNVTWVTLDLVKHAYHVSVMVIPQDVILTLASVMIANMILQVQYITT